VRAAAVSCAQVGPHVWVETTSLPPPLKPAEKYRIAPGDLLAVRVYREKPFHRSGVRQDWKNLGPNAPRRAGGRTDAPGARRAIQVRPQGHSSHPRSPPGYVVWMRPVPARRAPVFGEWPIRTVPL